MKKALFALSFAIASTSLIAQNKKDAESIKEMCGCYEVTFNFTETFQHTNDSLYKPSKDKIATALEWAELIEDEKGKISIQHLLQVGPAEHPHIVKHWRQDWVYQNQNFFMFNGDNEWLYQTKPKSAVKKQWTQKVFQVDDSPRYEGTSTWVHADGKSYWENTTDAPLPRREYTQRADYNVTERGNRHEITEFGWLHDQDNVKVIRQDGEEDVKVASEKGYNTYVKVDDKKCKAAQDWWKKNQEKWALVRAEWALVYRQNKDLKLKEKVNNKVLFKHLFDDEIDTQEEIRKVITDFVIR
ncbi:MAG: DUF6607 family protein [Flavobacteriales bacterium]